MPSCFLQQAAERAAAAQQGRQHSSDAGWLLEAHVGAGTGNQPCPPGQGHQEEALLPQASVSAFSAKQWAISKWATDGETFAFLESLGHKQMFLLVSKRYLNVTSLLQNISQASKPLIGLSTICNSVFRVEWAIRSMIFAFSESFKPPLS